MASAAATGVVTGAMTSTLTATTASTIVDIKGRLAINDVDWKNVDRRKIRFDRGQLTESTGRRSSTTSRKTTATGSAAEPRTSGATRLDTVWSRDASARCPEDDARRPEEAAASQVERQAVSGLRDSGYKLVTPSKTYDRQETRNARRLIAVSASPSSEPRRTKGERRRLRPES